MLTRLTLSVALLLTGIAFQVAPAMAEEAQTEKVAVEKPAKMKKAGKAKKQIASKVDVGAESSGDAKAGADAFVPYGTGSELVIGN